MSAAGVGAGEAGRGGAGAGWARSGSGSRSSPGSSLGSGSRISALNLAVFQELAARLQEEGAPVLSPDESEYPDT